MPEVLDDTAGAAPPPRAGSLDTPSAATLQRTSAAVRVSFTWLGVRKALTPGQKAEAAKNFGAEGPYLTAGKKLLDTRHPAYRALTVVRGKALGYWRAVSLPYPEPGIRLIRQEQVALFDRQMARLREELIGAVARLDARYAELREAARRRLGRLYDPSDYPTSLAGHFALDWDYPSVEPPDYLLRLDPRLYEQETARAAARFEEAVRLAEQAFTAEFAKLVSHLAERLAGTDDGRPKVFRDSAVANLQEFFNRFRALNVHSNEELDELVETTRRAVAGLGPQELRDNMDVRRQVGQQLSVVQSTLDEMLVERPRRRVLRPAAPAAGR